jgi:hypothetical protein
MSAAWLGDSTRHGELGFIGCYFTTWTVGVKTVVGDALACRMLPNSQYL